MKSICRSLGWLLVVVVACAVPAAAKRGYGTLSGVVLDPSGTPQMGATVWLISEDAGGRTVSQLLSNQYGAFFTDHLKPGKFAVRVSLTGFLPTIESHIAVMADLTTLLRVQMDSVFASLDTLRRKSDAPAEPDNWKWVLRSSTATRTVLQWRDADTDIAVAAAACHRTSRFPRPRTASFSLRTEPYGPVHPQTFRIPQPLRCLTISDSEKWEPCCWQDKRAINVEHPKRLPAFGFLPARQHVARKPFL